MSVQASRYLDATKASFPSPLSETSAHKYRAATAEIHTFEDLERFLKSSSAQEFLSFVLYLNNAVSGVSFASVPDTPSPGRPVIDAMISIFKRMRLWVDDIPPVKENARFGSPSFRLWYDKVLEESPSLIKGIIPESIGQQEGLCEELQSYFIESFGNRSRIDYGTGHETAFVAFLFCMAKAGIFHRDDAVDLIRMVFVEYLETVRKIQRVYCLEPAGTRGVWGLDDYQILPFMWGSSQLVGQDEITPCSVQRQAILDKYSNEYLYISCIKFIRDIKSGPFHETSPMLYDISGVESWSKINTGMIKMYLGELLSKRPVMQHFMLGSILTMN